MLNKVILIGNLGADPEVRYMPNGSAITTIRLATSMRWKDKQTGEKKESTEWHRVVFFERLAEVAGEYLKKGAKVYIEGRLRTQKWQDQNGHDRYTTEIIARDMHMLDSRSGGTGHFGNESPATEHQSSTPPSHSMSPSTSQSNTMPPAPPPVYDDFDDDIPF